MVSDILIWNKDIGFIRISEGTGDNLTESDRSYGYVDYINIDFLEYDGMNLVESDGGMVMLEELYQEKFRIAADVIQFLMDLEEIPEVTYTVLWKE